MRAARKVRFGLKANITLGCVSAGNWFTPPPAHMMLQTLTMEFAVKGVTPGVRLTVVWLKSLVLTLLVATVLALHAFGVLFWVLGPLLFRVQWGVAVLASFAAIAVGQALIAIVRWYNRKVMPEIMAARRALGLEPPTPIDPGSSSSTEPASATDDGGELLASALGPKFVGTAMILYRVLAVVGLGGMALMIYGFGESLILGVQEKPGVGLSYAEGWAGALIGGVSGLCLFVVQTRLSDRLSRFTRQATPWGPSPSTSDRLWRALRPMQRSRPWAKRPRSPADRI